MDLHKLRKLAGLGEITELTEALEIREPVTIRKNIENEVKEIRASKAVANAIADHITGGMRVDMKDAGMPCLYVNPKTGADYPGIIFSNNPGAVIKFNNSNDALDAANDQIASTNFRFYQFKASVVVGPKA